MISSCSSASRTSPLNKVVSFEDPVRLPSMLPPLSPPHRPRLVRSIALGRSSGTSFAGTSTAVRITVVRSPRDDVFVARMADTARQATKEGVAMAIGPVQLIVLGFDQPEFHGEIVAELEKLKKSGTVRVIDALA